MCDGNLHILQDEIVDEKNSQKTLLYYSRDHQVHVKQFNSDAVVDSVCYYKKQCVQPVHWSFSTFAKSKNNLKVC